MWNKNFTKSVIVSMKYHSIQYSTVQKNYNQDTELQNTTNPFKTKV